jgi:hypothetical protein
VAEKVAQRLPPSTLSSSRNLDVTWITDRILATSKPAEAPIPTRNDTGRNGISTFTPNDNTTSATPIHEEQHQLSLHYSTKPRAGVNPGALSSFLTRRHDHHFLLINLSEEEPDDRTLFLLMRGRLGKRIARFRFNFLLLLEKMFEILFGTSPIIFSHHGS